MAHCIHATVLLALTAVLLEARQVVGLLRASNSSSVDESYADPASCKTLVFTTYFLQIPDWQRGGFRHETANPILVHNYRTHVLGSPGVHAILLHDGLPEKITKNLEKKGKFMFQKVSPADYDPLLGVNDVRFLIIQDLVKKYPEYPAIFHTDLFDVKVLQNPCSLVLQSPSQLFVGSEVRNAFDCQWLRDNFRQMGGKYNSWYADELRRKGPQTMFNAGVVGGARATYVDFLEDMVEVLKDPALSPRTRNESVNVDMAALNYVIRSNRTRLAQVFTGHPLHSEFGAHQAMPGDFFQHK